MKSCQLLNLLFPICLLSMATEVKSSAPCSVPQWPISTGENPMTLASGKVLLVALMKGYCQYCWHQAHYLELLKSHLYNRGIRDIEMIIVNGGESISRAAVGNFVSYTNLTVYQDTESNILFNLFGGNKDDFIFYDRCGQRAAYLPHPYSFLGRTYTERVLRALHRGRSRCPCNLDPPQGHHSRQIRSAVDIRRFNL